MKILSIGYTSVDAGGPYNVAENYKKFYKKIILLSIQTILIK